MTPPPELRREHSIEFRIIEAKGFSDQPCDTYCLIKFLCLDPSIRQSLSAHQSLECQGMGGGQKHQSVTSMLNNSSKRPSQTFLQTLLANSNSSSNSSAGTEPTHLAYNGRSKTVQSSNNPRFEEQIDIEELPEDFSEIIVELWQKSLIKDRLIGRCSIKQLALLPDHKAHDEWYPLESSPCSARSSEEQLITEGQHHSPTAEETPAHAHVGQLRLRYTYARQRILPITAYSRLISLFLQDNQFRVLTILGRVTTERDQVARHIVAVFEQNAQALPFLQHVLAIELQSTKDPNTLYRANSLASKAVDQYLKLVAGRYLVRTLKPVITEIQAQNRTCELDPSRIAGGLSEIEEHRTVLEAYIRWTLDRVFESVKDCPLTIRHMFAFLKQEAERQFPNNPMIGYIAVTSFLFLRFFNAAILGPQLFGLMAENHLPSARNGRTLTLISKTIQQLANFTTFDRAKEPFMEQLNPLIQENRERITGFIDNLTQNIPDTRTPRKSWTSSLSNEPISPSSRVPSFIKKIGESIGSLFGISEEGEGDYDFREKRVDIEINLAALYRHLTQNYQKMLETAADDLETRDLLELEKILAEMRSMEISRRSSKSLDRSKQQALLQSSLQKSVSKSKTID